MAGSENTRTLPVTRRLLLAGAGLSALPQAAAVAAEEASPDAEFLAFAAKWEALQAEYHPLCLADAHRDRNEQLHQQRIDDLVDEMSDLEWKLCDMPVCTLPGLSAKAKILRSFIDLGPDGDGPQEDAYARDWFIWTLCNDLLQLAGVVPDSPPTPAT